MSAVGIGVIGCGGRITGVLSRIPGMGKDMEVRALMDVSPDSVKRARERLETEAKSYDDYNDLVKDPNIEWVFVGSWNAQHRDHSVAALEAGKHVFCEKPLATTLKDCIDIRKAKEKSGKIFSLGLVLRYSKHYQAIRDIIRSGKIGRILSMEFNETLHYEHGGYIHGDWRRLTKHAGSHVLEKCCHDLDLVNWILDSAPVRAASFGGLDFFVPENEHYVEKLGPGKKGRPAFSSWARPVEISPFTRDKDIVDNQVSILQYANGVRATFHTNCLTNINERRMYICGTEGTIRADVISGQIEYRRIGHEDPLIPVETGAKGGHGGADGTLCDSLAESILHGAPPLAGAEDGIASSIAAFGIDEALATGQVVDMTHFWKEAGIEPKKAQTFVEATEEALVS